MAAGRPTLCQGANEHAAVRAGADTQRGHCPTSCLPCVRQLSAASALTNRIKVLDPRLQVPQQHVVQDGALVSGVALLCGCAPARRGVAQAQPVGWPWAADAGKGRRLQAIPAHRRPLPQPQPPSRAHSRHTRIRRPGGGPAPPLRRAPCLPCSSASAPPSAPRRRRRAGRCWGRSAALQARERGARPGGGGRQAGRGVQAGSRLELLRLPSSGQAHPTARPAHRRWTKRRARWWVPTAPG